jgi:hypothetical protein
MALTVDRIMKINIAVIALYMRFDVVTAMKIHIVVVRFITLERIGPSTQRND